MLYKKKKPVIFIIFTYLFYAFATIFIVLGLFNLSNFAYKEYNKDKINEPTPIAELALQPIEMEVSESNNVIQEVKEEDIPLAKDPKVEAAMKQISDYYVSNIGRYIKPHFAAKKDNMCSLGFNVNKAEVAIVNCDDYAFGRQIELSLAKFKPYNGKVVNGVDLSKEIVYFNYLTK
jgi:hypothetical protein